MKEDKKVCCDHTDKKKCKDCLHALPHEPLMYDCTGEGVCWDTDGKAPKVRYQQVRCRVVQKEKNG